MARHSDVLFVSTGRFVIALRPDTGVEIWRTKLPSGASCVISLLLKDRDLFVGHSGRVYCLAADTGRILWENGLPRTGFGPVIMATAGAVSSTAVVAAAYVAEVAAQSSG